MKILTIMNLKIRLSLMNFLEFAVWGAYLTSMGTYLVKIGMADQIGWFYAVQGIVSIFMPAIMGIVADRWVPAQRLNLRCRHFRRFDDISPLQFKRSFLYAHAGFEQLCGLYGAEPSRHGHRERLSADTRFWHNRIYLHHVVC